MSDFLAIAIYHSGTRDLAVAHDVDDGGNCWCGPQIRIRHVINARCDHPQCPIPDLTVEFRHFPVAEAPPPDQSAFWDRPDSEFGCPCEEDP